MGQPAEALANYDPMNEQHVRDAFLQAIAIEAKRADALIAAFSNTPEKIEDELTAAKMTDYAKQLGVCASEIEAKRREHKGRYDLCGAVIQTAATAYTDQLKGDKRKPGMKLKIEQRLTDYQSRKANEERKRREDEARKAAEEAKQKEAELKTEDELDEAIRAGAEAERAQQAAEAKPADLHKDRGEFGSVASLRSVLAFEIVNAAEINLDNLRPYLSRDVIEKAIRGFMRDHADYIKEDVRAGKTGPLHGVRFFEKQETRVR